MLFGCGPRRASRPAKKQRVSGIAQVSCDPCGGAWTLRVPEGWYMMPYAPEVRNHYSYRKNDVESKSWHPL